MNVVTQRWGTLRYEEAKVEELEYADADGIKMH
jgi:hypothetical protein